MFNLSYDTPSKIAGTIRVTRPIYSLGNVVDVDGKWWNIHAIYGKVVNACPMDQLHPYYSDTSGRGFSGLISQSWEPYSVEVVEEVSA